MLESRSSDGEKRLADRLKREASATRPAFSENLHARICQALQRCEAPASLRPKRRRLPRRWVLVAVAATLLVSACLAAWRLFRPPGPAWRPIDTDIVVVDVPDPAGDPDVSPVVDPEMITGPAGDAAEQVVMLVDSTLSTGQWAYLDHDARVAVELLVGQLPFDVESIE